MTVGWLLSPSGWPVHADSDDEHAELTGRGYDPITEDQVAPAVAAFQAAEASPPSTQLPGYALAADVAAALATKADAAALATKANASSLALKQDKATLGADAAAAPELRAAFVPRDADALRAFTIAVADRDNTPVNVWFLGDSIIEGQGSGDPMKRAIALIADQIDTAFPTAGVTDSQMYLPAYYEATGMTQPAVTTGTVTKNSSYGFGGRSYRLDPGATISWRVTGTAADLMYVKATSTGPMTIAVDGVDVVANLQTAKTAPNTDGNVQRLTFATPGVHTITVRPLDGSTSPIYVGGVVPYFGNESKGFRFIDAGHWGWNSANVASGGGGGTALTERAAAFPPALVVCDLGPNDYSTNTPLATFAANMQQIITLIRAAAPADPSFLLLGMYKRDGSFTYPWADYVAELRQLADGDPDIAFLDVGARMPPVLGDPYGLYVDQVHPNPKGHRALAAAVAPAIARHAVVQPSSESVFIPAPTILATSGSPAMVQGAGAYAVMAFDQTTQEGAAAWRDLPSNWKAVNVELIWANASTGSGDVVWRVQVKQQPYGGLGEASLSDVSQTVTAGAQWTAQRTAFGQAVPVSNGKLTGILIIRVAAAAGDTLTGDAGVIGVRLTRAA